MPNIENLISGFKVFKSTAYQRQKDIIHHLLEQGHKPTTMVISSCELRISPKEIFSTNPGDLYIVNTLGALVPKYETEGIHGILSAIEYAVTVLEVQNIVILGHAKCNSIHLMMSDQFFSDKKLSQSMKTWLSVAKEARDVTKEKMSDKTLEEQQSYCEQESIIVSMRNLLTYPYVIERMKKDKLNVYGWHFDIESGDIIGFNPESLNFESLS